MPQMMPMLWSLMLILLISLMLITSSFMYFFYNLHLTLYRKLITKKSSNLPAHLPISLNYWTWKW